MYKTLKKVIVGMSGGVDSSVAAYLLQKQGYHVEGLFMKNWEEDDNENYCASKNDLADAREVCDKLNIKLHTVNFSAEYWDKVFKIFLKEYKSGRTPNPDILCNKEIKFKTFLEFAIEELCADYIATGHYVRSNKIDGKIQLLRGLDQNKDQSYFLYTLNQTQIKKSLFPIGMLEKLEVRKIAKELGFINANKRDSTGICFIGKRNFRKFLSKYIPAKPGIIFTIDGTAVGEHQGLMYYTIGQRKGLGIGGIKNSTEKPWYVVDKNLEKNILLVAQGRDHPSLMSIGLIAKKIHWIDKKFFTGGIMTCTAKTRYRQIDTVCKVISFTKNSIKVYFEGTSNAVTPGQSIVFYSNEICLGGGIIKYRLPLRISS